MTPFSKNTIQHFNHSHPLTKVPSNTNFLCNGCQTLGFGTRYRCEPCDFDLHLYCANFPVEISSFMHPPHALKLVVSKPNIHVCDMCDESVDEGLSYRCEVCKFDVHPICTQLPEYLPHVGHKAHPLRLQPGSNRPCTFCKNTCSSWHYTCGACCFDLHLGCVLAPCVEDVTTTVTSLKRPAAPHPSTSAAPYVPPSFNGYYGYGYGGMGIPPPPQFAPPPPPPPPYFVPYGHGAGYGVPYGYNNQVQGSGGKVRNKIYEITIALGLNVLANALYDSIF